MAFERYASVLDAARPEPALLWTQRWLTPESARWRAEYVANHPLLSDGPIVFLGEDDAVSPLAALLEPDREIIVIDVDSAVLEMVSNLAAQLGATLTVIHHDLSQGLPSIVVSAAAVVCDPFPTRNAMFERAFWREAAKPLPEGALLFTTSHPSHKPSAFARPALRALDDVGFTLVDAVRDAGRYAMFDFELMDYELQALAAHGLWVTISHTKSLLCAVRTADPYPPVPTDLAASPVSLAGHYLTQQYGVEAQVHISETRGKGRLDVATLPSSDAPPLFDVPALLKGLAEDAARGRLAALLDRADPVAVCDYLDDVADLAATTADAETLVSLHQGRPPETVAAERLALVVRALESWNR